MATLHVWMNGQHVGLWTTSRGGVPLFRYDPAWTQAPLARALSLSLPMTAGAGEHRGDVVAHYFENLLPDSADIRKRLGARFKTRSTSAFDLLAAIGRDCVGAVQLLPEGMEPQGWNRVEASPLNEEQVERFLKNATTAAPLGQRVEEGGDDDFRISIAGAQEKTALLRFGGAWHRPLGATPTTHIMKLPLGRVGNMQADMSNSVENEWLCAQLVRELGLPVARVAMARFGAQRALVVERFDRRWQGVEPGVQDEPGFLPPRSAWVARLPQEDLCQATGTSPNLKYEADGGAHQSPHAWRCWPAVNRPTWIVRTLRWHSLLSGCWPPQTAMRRTSPSSTFAAAASGSRPCMTCFLHGPSWARDRTASPSTRQSWPWRCTRRTPTTSCARFGRATGGPWRNAAERRVYGTG